MNNDLHPAQERYQREKAQRVLESLAAKHISTAYEVYDVLIDRGINVHIAHDISEKMFPTPPEEETQTIEQTLTAHGYGHQRVKNSAKTGRHAVYSLDTGEVVGEYDAAEAILFLGALDLKRRLEERGQNENQESDFGEADPATRQVVG